MIDFETYCKNMTPISSRSWGEFFALFKPRILKQDEYFISVGQTEKLVAFIESGVIRSFYRSQQAIEYNKQFCVNPDFIGGYSSLITKTPSKVSQQALTDCSIRVTNYADLYALYQSCLDIERVARMTAELLFVQKEEREIEIVLLDPSERYRLFQKRFPKLEQLIPQYHIASYLGITSTQLSRIRRKLSGK